MAKQKINPALIVIGVILLLVGMNQGGFLASIATPGQACENDQDCLAFVCPDTTDYPNKNVYGFCADNECMMQYSPETECCDGIVEIIDGAIACAKSPDECTVDLDCEEGFICINEACVVGSVPPPSQEWDCYSYTVPHKTGPECSKDTCYLNPDLPGDDMYSTLEECYESNPDAGPGPDMGAIITKYIWIIGGIVAVISIFYFRRKRN